MNEDETSVQNMSELEGIALKSCQMMCEIPPVTKCSKEAAFGTGGGKA